MRTILCLLFLLSDPVVAGQVQKEVPRKFQGEWNMKLSDCGTSLNDSVLYLQRSIIRYYESVGPVHATVTKGFELALIAELSGEGETRVHAAQYRLSRDGRTLTDMSGTPALKRYRCPAGRR